MTMTTQTTSRNKQQQQQPDAASTESSARTDNPTDHNNNNNQQLIRPVPDQATWRLIRETYRQVKVEHGGLDDWDHQLLDFFADHRQNDNKNDNVASSVPQPLGFHVPIFIQPSPGKGRGVFAAQFIPQDTCVLSDCAGHFVTQSQWQAFLQALQQHDPCLARDVVSWAYVCEYTPTFSSSSSSHDQGPNKKQRQERQEEEEQEAVWLDLFEGSLVNHGDSIKHRRPFFGLRCCPTSSSRNSNDSNDKNKKDTANLDEGRFHDGKWHMHASRDIQAGEELLCDYNEFHEDEHGLTWFDDSWREYWPDSPLHGF